MKTLLIAIDSKFIHTNLAVRYLKANTTYETQIMEFTIKDSIAFILDKITKENPDIIAFSCYIWNIEMITHITNELKSKLNSIILWGGPEVSYDAFYYMDNSKVDYIIKGEGELAFHEFLSAVDKVISFSQVSGLMYREDNKIISNKEVIIKDLNQLKSPYRFDNDTSNIHNKIQYIETSRGCPFHCSYCLASLENNVRFFDIEKVKTEILYLVENGGKTFKFLDRTFNVLPKYAKEMFSFIIQNHPENASFQFEITGDILKEELIHFLNEKAPSNLFRFEIGIQSTNIKTNEAVLRIQNNKVLFHHIKLLKEGNIVDMHLDLIAGLPYETLQIFQMTFNEVFLMYAKELQLGFLKMLRGTLIRDEASKYGYVHQQMSPYEILNNDFLSKEDVLIIHEVEEILEIFWNKGFMNESVEWITRKVESVFSWFYQFSKFLHKRDFDFHRYQLDEVFSSIDDFVKETRASDHPHFTSLLKKEYLLRHSIKPKIWWNKNLVSKNKHLREIQKEYPKYAIDDYYKYGVITPYDEDYLVVLYFPNETISFTV
ncbi:MAG: DUF4080 domain-containing protein [Candidatus Izemoplasmatales bacterium]|jgi:radical SAM superfamily enzyme YgiQ (UPF0313 family)|nr:DUF4080 domain-containing protein [Candidatus Izemoplasmatales bacterium]